MYNNRMSTVITTCCVGAAVGAATYMMSNGNSKKVKKMKRNAGKTLRQVSGFIDNVSHIVGR